MKPLAIGHLSKRWSLAKETGYSGWEVAPFMLTDDIRSFDADVAQRLSAGGRIGWF